MQHSDPCKIIERISIYHCNKKMRETLLKMEDQLSRNNFETVKKARKNTIQRYPCCEKYL